MPTTPSCGGSNQRLDQWFSIGGRASICFKGRASPYALCNMESLMNKKKLINKCICLYNLFIVRGGGRKRLRNTGLNEQAITAARQHTWFFTLEAHCHGISRRRFAYLQRFWKILKVTLFHLSHIHNCSFPIQPDFLSQKPRENTIEPNGMI